MIEVAAVYVTWRMAASNGLLPMLEGLRSCEPAILFIASQGAVMDYSSTDGCAVYSSAGECPVYSSSECAVYSAADSGPVYSSSMSVVCARFTEPIVISKRECTRWWWQVTRWVGGAALRAPCHCDG